MHDYIIAMLLLPSCLSTRNPFCISVARFCAWSTPKIATKTYNSKNFFKFPNHFRQLVKFDACYVLTPVANIQKDYILKEFTIFEMIAFAIRPQTKLPSMALFEKKKPL